MFRTWFRMEIAALFAMGLATGAPAAAQAPVLPVVSLKILNESAPVGATVQMKVFVTEPRPITTGGGRVSFSDFDPVGIAVMGSDTWGIALTDLGGLVFSFVSPAATLGTTPDYPILTVAGRVAATAQAGTQIPFELDAASMQFFDASGVAYPIAVAGGTLAVAPNMSISDVRPGSGTVDTGGVVTIVGSGFAPDTKVTFRDTLLSDVRFINSSRIDVVLAQPAAMQGMRVRAFDRSGRKATYYAYQRTRPAGISLHPVLARAIPLFPPQTRTLGVIGLAGASSGLALQNIGLSGIDATADLLDGAGKSLSSATITIPAGKYVVRDISEIFHMVYSPSNSVRVAAAGGIQMMGIALDAAGSARPLAPR